MSAVAKNSKKHTQTKSKPNSTVVSKRRLTEPSKYKLFRKGKKIIRPKIPTARALLKNSISNIRENQKFFVLSTLLYLFLNIVLVQGFGLIANSSVTNTKELLNQQWGGNNLENSFIIFGDLLGQSTQTAGSNSVYQTILIIMFSLAIVWTLRQSRSTKLKRTSVRDALYQGMYPIVPVIIVLFFISLQLLPMSIGLGVQSTINYAGGLGSTWEEAVILLFVILSSWLSLYWVLSSMFALVIVTLPDTPPMLALKKASQLVKHRRLVIASKLLWYAVAILLVFALVIVPFIAFVPAIAGLVFYLAGVLLIPLSVTYIYELYRSLI